MGQLLIRVLFIFQRGFFFGPLCMYTEGFNHNGHNGVYELSAESNSSGRAAATGCAKRISQ